jgi:RNA polymerase sigma-70 factor (ECF subfamily)
MADRAARFYTSVLVVRCQAGDRAAFGELVAVHQQRLFYFLHKMLRDVHAAEDVLQEVWLAVFRDLPGLADPGAFVAWLYRIARHRVLHELRKRRQPLSPLEDLDGQAEETPDEVLSAEDAEEVHAAIDELAPEHREVLLLRFIEEMSYQEMAGVLGCRLGTVRSRLHYAKAALRRALERKSDHERERAGGRFGEACQ